MIPIASLWISKNIYCEWYYIEKGVWYGCKRQKNSIKPKQKSPKTDGWNKITVITLFSLVFSIVSIIVSAVSSFGVAKYQRDQSLVPNVCFLNQAVRIPFSIDSDSEFFDYGGELDYSTIDKSYYPLRIPIRNIGVGLAQNISVEFGIDSQIQVLEQCRERLEQCRLYPRTYSSPIGTHTYKSVFFLDHYCFRYYDDELDNIEYLGCPYPIEHYNNLDEISISVFPYILPLNQEDSLNYIVLPEYLSAFILEAIHQEMIFNGNSDFDPIVLDGTISYQDIDGERTAKDFELRFTKFSNSFVYPNSPEIFLQIESN